MVATDRETLRAATRQYEHAERRLEDWAFERRRRVEQMARFHASTSRAPRSSSNAERAAEAVNVFHRKERMSKQQRLKLQAQEEHERARRRNERKAERRELRGRGPVQKCTKCSTIFRGEACGCRPCAHCGKLFRTAGFKCQPCKDNPELLTARGTQTRSGLYLEAQPAVSPLSPDAKRIDVMLDQLPPWMSQAIEERYLYKQTDHKAAENLMIAVPVFTGRLRAAVARVAETLAIEENARV